MCLNTNSNLLSPKDTVILLHKISCVLKNVNLQDIV